MLFRNIKEFRSNNMLVKSSLHFLKQFGEKILTQQFLKPKSSTLNSKPEVGKVVDSASLTRRKYFQKAGAELCQAQLS